MKWKCKECDSEVLEQLAWCNVNTNTINDWQDSGTIYCCECGAEDSAVGVMSKLELDQRIQLEAIYGKEKDD